MYVANINEYLPASPQATTVESFSGDVQFTPPGFDASESYLPDATLMLTCFFIAVLVIFFLISVGYALFYHWREPSESLYASETNTTFSRGRTPTNSEEHHDELQPPNDQSNDLPASDKAAVKIIVTGIESVYRSIVARFFKKKSLEYGNVWHTEVSQDVRQVNIDVVALQNLSVPLRSLDDDSPSELVLAVHEV